jgi:outer membrane protein OmpA-like peptidoglycan-associated protein
VLYFPLNGDRLGDSAQAALAELVRYVQSAGNITININGHADRVGSDDYNMDLSARRARFVVQALKAAGVPEKMMGYFAFGESDPAVPTADGVAEPKNRRVEIFIE